MKSSMQNVFATVPSAHIPRSKFNRSFSHKTTFDMGYLVPIILQEILPADTMTLRSHFFGRLATPLVPPMDNIYMDVHYFFVPNRLVWSEWKRFCGERYPDPDTTIDITIPILDVTKAPLSTGFTENSLADYFGLPTKVLAIPHISALPFRCYNAIYTEWYRDQNLIDSPDIETGAGPDDPGIYELKKRGKRHDYFTSCLPWPQKGTAVELPLGDTAPVVGNDGIIGVNNGSENKRLLSTTPPDYHIVTDSNWSTAQADLKFGSMVDLTLTGLETDLSAATASTINELRQAFQIQKLMERDARSGSRYPEILKSHFGVYDPSMAVLQRPEYLGGGRIQINVHPVAQTSEKDTTPIGTLGGFGTMSGQLGFSKSFTEHGYVMGIVSVIADLTYQNSLTECGLVQRDMISTGHLSQT